MLRVNCEVMNPKETEKIALIVHSHSKDRNKVLIQIPGEDTLIEVYGGELITACENAMNSGRFCGRRYYGVHGDDD